MTGGYQLNHRFRGTALIIGNEFKGQGSSQRAGCLEDVRMLTEVFVKLDFNVSTFLNLTAAQMKEKLEKASRDENNKYSDCFVFALSTHGNEVRLEKEEPTESADIWRHAVLGEDEGHLFVDEIMDMFADDKTKALAGKPKLFFLQACRSRNINSIYSPSPGDTYDQGVEVTMPTVDDLTEKMKKCFTSDFKDSEDWLHTEDLTDTEDIYKDWEKDPDEWKPETAERTPGSQPEHDATGGTVEEDAGGRGDTGAPPPSPFDIVPIKCPDDFLIMYPVMSGKFAFRNSRAGSYLIQFLHKGENLTKLLRGCDLLQYLTFVCHDMAGYEFKPDLEVISHNNRIRALQAKRAGKRYDPLITFKDQLYGNVKFLSQEENQDLLVRTIGKTHEKQLRGHASAVEPYLQGLINSLTEQEMKDILKEILPFKMTACMVHRLKGSVVFQPKRNNSPMAKLKVKFLAKLKKETFV